MGIKSSIVVILAFTIILGPGLSHAQRGAQSNSAIRSAQQLLNEERQQNRQQLNQLKQELLDYYWDIRLFPSSLQGLLENIYSASDWNGPYTDSQLLIDVWGNSICYKTLGTVPVANPYNKDGSAAQVPKAQLWSNDPEDRCVNSQDPQATASVVFVQPNLSQFARKVRERLDITVRMFNQSGLILVDLDTALGVPIPPDEAVDQILALSEYHKRYEKEKHLWNTNERLFYNNGLNRQSENGSGDDVVPSVAIGKGSCKTTITSDITTNTTWILANSPYCIGANVSITQDFQIDPGVQVLFLGNYNVTIIKEPTIDGTANAPILFSSYVIAPGPNKYEGGYVDFQDNATLRWVIMEYARGLVESGGGNLEIHDSTLRRNGADGSGDHGFSL